MSNSTFKKCPICNDKNISYLKGFENLFLKKCKQCKFVFDERKPSEQELNDHYSVYSYSSLKPVSDQTVKSFNVLLDKFEEYRQTGNILDIGCGQGDFLVEAKKRNWNVYGSEYSDFAFRLCNERDIHMHKGALTDNDFNGVTFDVITSFEVIEHINNPNDFMSVAKKCLRGNGLFYCTTPNFNSVLRNFENNRFKIIVYPEHISFYTKKSIKFLGDLHNFKAMKLETTGLDIGRMMNAFKKVNKNNKTSYDRNKSIATNETIRKMSNSNWFMSRIKDFINIFLSIFGKGDTLKVFWIKNNEKQ